ncbi:YeiH family protein [Pseudorhodoferax soli]|uniref:Putative integral membrane protein (TIGR00698 family) n=1 Tax=Pseudorhodoferax soli TaxID=545864 RepID=A0A368XKW9_9BURK|nr:putative sulfate exporter family transporter [Pseudorhodoferax soli]RCW68671.1 putative integral membrane protein (TIGR00698 family) [Pseudorhodoferax soli]
MILVHKASAARAALTRKWPGLVVCVTVACAATFLSQHYGGPQLLYALLIGLAFHFLHGNPQISAGVDFCARTLLRTGVALLGARITVDQVAHLGLRAGVIVALGLALTIMCGLALARLGRRRMEEGLLSGGAVAICGASAAMAIAATLPSTRENERLTLFTVVGVTVFSTIAMVLYPFALHFLPLSAVDRGVFLGGTIHDVAQVVAAGMLLGPETADAATVVKLFRVLLLVPVVLLITVALRRYSSAGTGGGRPPAVPFFLIAFIALVAVSSLNIWPAGVVTAASDASRWLLVTAIAAAGVKTSFEELLKMGWWPVLMLLGETLFIAAFVMVALLFV